ncbi:MAG: TetR/AcrR family transcriptional regulator, partial [Actinomycetota bacterium]
AEMLLAVYRQGVAAVAERVDQRLADASPNPRNRLEAALVGHVEAVLDPSPYARVIVSVLPNNVPELASELTAERERYESRWRQLISDLDPPGDPALLRLFLLGAANATQLWYRPGGATPEEIGRSLAQLVPR